MTQNDKIKRAIEHYYTDKELTIIYLKNSWVVEGVTTLCPRHTLKLNDYASIEITRYNNTPLVQVYVGISENILKRPRWINRGIDAESTQEQINSVIGDLLIEMELELDKIKHMSITVHAANVSNQLSN